MKHFKLFFALFAMLALGVGNAWAETATVDFSTLYNADTDVSSTTFSVVEGISLVFNKETGSTAPKYYKSGTAVRLYAKGTMTVSSTIGKITKITLAYGSSDKTNTISVNCGSFSTSNWTGEADQVVFTIDGTSGHRRIKAVEVTYTSSAGGEDPGTGGETPEPEPDPTPDPGTGGEETWTLVTNASNLKVGDQVVIAAKDYNVAISTTQNSNNRGQATVTKSGDNITFGADVQVLTLEAGTKSSTFGLNTGSGYLYASSSSGNQLKTQTTNNDNGSWSISISSGTATIIANGTNSRNVMQYNQSSSLFACYGSASQKALSIYKKVTSSGETPETPTPSVSVAPESHTFATTNVGETATQEFTITAENTTATLSASIDNTTDFAISAITGDKVTVTYQPQSAGDHTATMTVKAGEEASTTVALTGKAVAALEGTWILVTDASSLKAGDEIIIASKDENYALSRAQNTNNRGQVEVTKTDNTMTATTEAQVLTLQAGKTEGTLALYTGAGYLHAASSSANHLKTETELSDNSSWTIAVEADGTATLTAQGTYTRNTLCYNKSNKLFACYASTNLQQPIVIYKNTNGQLLAGLAYETTKYLTKLGDAFTTPTLTNPNSLTVTYSSSDNNVATVDNTGTVTIKAAGVVVITAAFAGDASYLEGSAKYTLCVTEHAGTEADPYSVADARRVIDVMETAEGVYATGIVSEIVTAYNASYGNITYNISVDGTTVADQLQAYRGKSYNGANFTSADDIKLGDEVVVKGNLKKHNTTYEFDADNQLVSLNRTKQQADLAYAETELTANVGEDFAEPTLSNPYSLSITYSSSNTTLATVNATTGEVTILAAGKVTITASTAGDATYAAGSASYNITITNPGLAVATLPFYFDGKRADIEGTAGMTHEGIDSDYNAAPYLKFNTAGDWAIVQFNSEPGEFSFLLKQNGQNAGTFTVYESANGEDYTPIWSGGDLGGNGQSATIEPTLSATARYVKFEYTTKGASTNYGLGSISIQKADHRAEAGIAWNPATVSLTVGDAFTAPTFNNPNGLSGITFVSDNETLATVDNAGAITLVSGKTGTATITAKFDGNSDYKDATVTCTITVNPKTETVVILAQYNGQWYALKNVEETAGKVLAALPVNYVGGKLYNVEEADKATIEWQRAAVTDGIIFKNGENYIYGTAGSTDLKLSTTECAWTLDGTTYKVGNRTFIYRAQANGFKNYNATTTPGTDDYSNLPVVTAPVYATGDAYGRSVNLGEDGYRYGTICLPFGSTYYTGAEFFECVGKEEGKVYIASVTTLVAGTPYIFLASATEVAVYGDGTTAATPGSKNGLVGTFTNDTEVAIGNYILKDNALCQAADICWVNANRAYLVMKDVPGEFTKMPGRRYIGMSTKGENAETGLENIIVPEGQAVKVISNGQLIIIRGGEKFNAQGQKL